MESKIISWLLNFVYPPKCLLCGRLEVELCRECVDSLEISIQKCPICGNLSTIGKTHEWCASRTRIDGLTSLFSFKDERVKTLIEKMKFGFNDRIPRLLIRRYKKMIEPKRFDLIIPVPLFWWRENWRGFNQAEKIGKAIGGEVRSDVVWRIKNTKQQAKMPSRKARLLNMVGVFEVVKPGVVSGKRILLVDDVYTSGASMASVTRELKKAGAKEVWGFVLAA